MPPYSGDSRRTGRAGGRLSSHEPDLQRLQPYPFEKLRQLFADLTPPADKSPIALSIGEPQTPAPTFVLEASPTTCTACPTTPPPRACQNCAGHRRLAAAPLQLPAVDAEAQVLPVNGTREALFAFAQAVVHAAPDALVMSPNPFYQIYEGAALLAGATRTSSIAPRDRLSARLQRGHRTSNGNSANCCISAARAIPPARSCRWRNYSS